MRVVLLVLMAVLLPLRGWMGDAMALGLVAPQHAHAHGVHIQAAAPGATHGSDPASHVHAAGSSAHDHHAHEAVAVASPCCDPPPVAEHLGCTACQVCHSVAMAAEPVVAARVQPSRMVPAQGAPSFTSAELRHGHKPPIS